MCFLMFRFRNNLIFVLVRFQLWCSNMFSKINSHGNTGKIEPLASPPLLSLLWGGAAFQRRELRIKSLFQCISNSVTKINTKMHPTLLSHLPSSPSATHWHTPHHTTPHHSLHPSPLSPTHPKLAGKQPRRVCCLNQNKMLSASFWKCCEQKHQTCTCFRRALWCGSEDLNETNEVEKLFKCLAPRTSPTTWSSWTKTSLPQTESQKSPSAKHDQVRAAYRPPVDSAYSKKMLAWSLPSMNQTSLLRYQRVQMAQMDGVRWAYELLFVAWTQRGCDNKAWQIKYWNWGIPTWKNESEHFQDVPKYHAKKWAI